ncbi:MAG: hypothetical protein ACOCRB_02305 [Halanaerobiaceae bacterium]
MSKKLWQFARRVDDDCIHPYIVVGLASYGPGIAFSDEADVNK